MTVLRPQGRLFAPLRASGRLRRPVRRVLAVVAGPNPSYDYYLAPRLGPAVGGPPVEAFDVWSPPRGRPPEALDGALILFCRYMTGRWLSFAERHADRIAGVGYFIDDDLDALFADPSVPLTYRARLVVLALAHRRRFARMLDVVWASNPRIARGHAIDDLRLVSPVASVLDRPLDHERGGLVRLAFHSTRVHAREHAWMSGVLRDVMADGTASLEVFASRGLRELWAGSPRTTIRAPLPWPAYREWTRREGADLLLAPLLAGPGNSARSPTKRIEALRLGAALLVSDPAVYRPTEAEAAAGFCEPPEPKAWASAIRALAGDRPRLDLLRSLNRSGTLAASESVAGLFRPGETDDLSGRK